MKRRLLLAVGAVVVLAVLAVWLMRWREMRKREEHAAKVLPDLHDEAFAAADKCDAADQSLRSTMAVGTARFGFYARTDRPRLAQTLTEVVQPIISSRQTACEHARTLLGMYVHDSPTLDHEAIARLARVHAHLAHLEALAAEMQATSKAIADGATDDELDRHFDRLRR